MTDEEMATAVLEGLTDDIKWTFDDQGKWVTLTEREILAGYGPYWRHQMTRIGRADLISDEHCIQDWVTAHWAWRVHD